MNSARYPTLSRSDCERLTTLLFAGETPPLDPAVEWHGEGEEADLVQLDNALDLILDTLAGLDAATDASERDAFEGYAAGILHAALRDIPIEILDDPGFWRYLSVRLWRFITWREDLTDDSVALYTDGTRNTECVPLRMYIRAQAIERDGDYSLASEVDRGADFWRSHVIRVRTGTAPHLARAFATEQREHHMTTSTLRPYARRLNRVWSNVVLHLYDDDDSARLVDELKSDE